MSGRPPEIEDPSNRWFIHRISGALLPIALKLNIAPNLISLLGLACGLMAGFAYAQVPSTVAALAGFACMIGWHVFDGLDGQVARATGKSSRLGRVLDGLCDYGTFCAIYLALGIALHKAGNPAWLLVLAAAVAHAFQSNFYEARRQAYVHRLSGKPALSAAAPGNFSAERLYDYVQHMSLRWSAATDEVLRHHGPDGLAHYRRLVAPILRSWCLLGANMRTLMIFFCCLTPLGPKAYLIFEITILTALMLVLECWLRQTESHFRCKFNPDISAPPLQGQ